MPTGKLKKFVPDKGFGFITPDDGADDIFAHTSQFSGDQNSLREGDKVTFESEWDEKKGKNRASSWSVTESGGGGGGGGSSASMQTGVLKKYFPDKGFGFISPDDGSDDVFAHSRQFTGGDPERLRDGDKVRFESEWDKKNNKNKAATWCLDGGGPGGCGGCGGMPPQGGPHPGFGYPPPHGYGGPPPFGYGAPPPGYGAPPPGYGAPPPGYGAPPPGAYGPMGGPPPGGDPRYQPYGAPPPGAYGAPPHGYGGPPPGYGMPPAGYGAPAPGGGPAPGGPPAPTMASAATPPLPAGWEQHTDPASGKPYFCNRSTGETSWTPPAAPASAPAVAPSGSDSAPPLPAGWEQATDPASGKPYYFNRSTNETKWERPA